MKAEKQKMDVWEAITILRKRLEDFLDTTSVELEFHLNKNPETGDHEKHLSATVFYNKLDGSRSNFTEHVYQSMADYSLESLFVKTVASAIIIGNNNKAKVVETDLTVEFADPELQELHNQPQ